MKKIFNGIFKPFLFSFLFALFVSCYLQPGTRVPWNNNQNGNFYNNQNSYNGFNPASGAISSEQKRCDQLQSITFEIFSACISDIQQYLAQVEQMDDNVATLLRNCNGAFNQMLYASCSNIQNELNRVSSDQFCGPFLRSSYISATCSQTVAKYVR